MKNLIKCFKEHTFMCIKLQKLLIYGNKKNSISNLNENYKYPVQLNFHCFLYTFEF